MLVLENLIDDSFVAPKLVDVLDILVDEPVIVPLICDLEVILAMSALICSPWAHKLCSTDIARPLIAGSRWNRAADRPEIFDLSCGPGSQESVPKEPNQLKNTGI